MDIDNKQLIDLVKQFPHLWDRVHNLFKDKHAKDSAWVSIAKILNTTSEACKQRWRVLHNKFIIELKTRQLQQAGGQLKHTDFFVRMQFLEDSLMNKKPSENQSSNAVVQIVELKHSEASYENTILPLRPRISSYSSESSCDNNGKRKNIEQSDAFINKKIKSNCKDELWRNLTCALEKCSTLFERKVEERTPNHMFMRMICDHLEDLPIDIQRAKKKENFRNLL